MAGEGEMYMFWDGQSHDQRWEKVYRKIKQDWGKGKVGFVFFPDEFYEFLYIIIGNSNRGEGGDWEESDGSEATVAFKEKNFSRALKDFETGYKKHFVKDDWISGMSAGVVGGRKEEIYDYSGFIREMKDFISLGQKLMRSKKNPKVLIQADI